MTPLSPRRSPPTPRVNSVFPPLPSPPASMESSAVAMDESDEDSTGDSDWQHLLFACLTVLICAEVFSFRSVIDFANSSLIKKEGIRSTRGELKRFRGMETEV